MEDVKTRILLRNFVMSAIQKEKYQFSAYSTTTLHNCWRVRYSFFFSLKLISNWSHLMKVFRMLTGHIISNFFQSIVGNFNRWFCSELWKWNIPICRPIEMGFISVNTLEKV